MIHHNPQHKGKIKITISPEPDKDGLTPIAESLAVVKNIQTLWMVPAEVTYKASNLLILRMFKRLAFLNFWESNSIFKQG